MTTALVDRLAHHSREESIECVGWYGSSDGPEPAISSAQATVHSSLFEEPWPTALILAEGGASGAFFLHDTRASRWFQAPFYEVSNAHRNGQAAKMTCIAWPAYLTTETVAPLSPAEPEETGASSVVLAPSTESAPSRGSVLSTFAQAIGSSGTTARRLGSALRSSITGRAEAKARKAAELAEKKRIAEAERKEQARIAHAERLERARAAAAAEQAERDRLASEQAERERLAAERERTERERAKWERAERERAERERAERERAERERAERERAERERAERERLAAARAEQARIAAKQSEMARRSEPVAAATNTAPPVAQQAPPARAAAPEPARPTTNRRHTPPRAADDGEDTTGSDQPYRYLALARREGFQVSSNLERTGADGAETVWLLSEAEFGLQITLVTSDLAVVEATLHYNIRIKDDAVLRATSPAHRHLDSRTIYVRESCVESLRARCRRLRATGALQRDWKVTPDIYPPDTAAQ